MVQKWYVIHVYSGFEKKVADHILEQVDRLGLGHIISSVLVPSESVVDVKRGRKIVTEQKFFPGYVLVKMDMTDEAWHLIRNAPKVTGFLGGKTKPSPLSDVEADRVLFQTNELKERRRTVEAFQVGESIRVSDGPFASFSGVIEELDEDRGRLRVMVSIFGRSTPVELEYTQVEKL
jgi:transcriptional antiterminator NusG